MDMPLWMWIAAVVVVSGGTAGYRFLRDRSW